MSSGSPKTSRFGVQAIFLVLFAVLCGIAGVGMRLWRQSPPVVEVPPAPPAQFRLVLAASDLLPGREIRASDFYTSMVGKEEYKKVLQNQSTFGEGKQLIGRLIRNKVEMNRPFPLDCVFPEGTGPTPADTLAEGMRAATVKMTLVGGIRGFVSPESWVDVLFRRSGGNAAPDSTAAARTHTVFPGVRVLAIQDSLYPETVLTKVAGGAVAQDFEITLELTPQQCEVLKSIENRGDLTLNMLPKEVERENLGSVPSPEIMKLLLGVEDPKPVPVAPYVPSVRVVRGGAQSSVIVDQSYDLIIDQQMYPAPDIPGAGDASGVPAPDSGSAAGPGWPQPIPPVRLPAPATSDTSGDAASESGVGGLKEGDEKEVDPIAPQPSRGTRANQDTIFAHRAGRVVYPGNSSRTVAIPVRPPKNRVSALSAAQPARPTRRVASSPTDGAVQARSAQQSRQYGSPPKRMVVLASGSRSGLGGIPSLSAMGRSSVQTGRAVAISTRDREQSVVRNSYGQVSVPVSATSRRTTSPASSPARPVIRSYAFSSDPSVRRTVGASGLVPLSSGARAGTESSLAYSMRSRNSGLPELKIGRR